MELALTLFSAIAWMYAYVRIIQVSIADRSYGIPLIAVTLNIAWELIYFLGGILYWGDYGNTVHVQTIINGIWLALDLVIIRIIWLYGAKEFPKLGGRYFRLMLSATILLSILIQVAFLVGSPAEEAAKMSAFLQNVFMSGAFIAMLLARRSGRAQRQDIAWARLLGTLAATITAGVLGGIVPMILVLGLCILVLDISYIFLLSRVKIIFRS